MNKLIFLIIFIMLISGCQIGSYKINIEKSGDIEELKSNITKVSILDLNLHPEQYDGEKIQVRGMAVSIGWVQRVILQDDDGIQVMVKDTIEDRSYDYEGPEYTAIGIFHNKEDLSTPFYMEATEPVRK